MGVSVVGLRMGVPLTGSFRFPGRWTYGGARAGVPGPPRGTMSRVARPPLRSFRGRVEEAPGHGPDMVEEPERGLGLGFVDCARAEEETKVNVDFFGGGVGDSPVVHSVST